VFACATTSADQQLAGVSGDEFGDALTALWGNSAPFIWNQRRAAVAGFLAWPPVTATRHRRCRPASSGAARPTTRPAALTVWRSLSQPSPAVRRSWQVSAAPLTISGHPT